MNGGIISGNPTQPTTSVASGIWTLEEQEYWKAQNKWPSASAGYTTGAVTFDGTNDYMLRGASLTGLADGKAFLLSFWAKLGGGDAAILRIMAADGGFFRVFRQTTNKWRIDGFNAGGTEILRLDSNTSYVSGGSWLHILASVDLAAAAGHFYVNDASDLAAGSILTNDTIDYTNVGANFAFGAGADGSGKFNGDLADAYFTNTYLDLSNAANRAKFISAGKPVSLGANGSLPTGTQPLLFQRGPAASFNTNLGSGGNFTVTGALTDAATSPSD